jgi:hypothetical protein
MTVHLEKYCWTSLEVYGSLALGLSALSGCYLLMALPSRQCEWPVEYGEFFVRDLADETAGPWALAVCVSRTGGLRACRLLRQEGQQQLQA